MQLKVFLHIDDERNIYRIGVEEEAPINNYEYLRALLIQSFPVLQQREFRITWLDSDSDQVTIASSADLRTFLLTNIASETKSLYVEVRSAATFNLPTVTMNLNQSTTPQGGTARAAPPVHRHVHCDSCDGPVIGNRYKCVECPDFDLCGDCEAAGHHSEHVMMRTADVELFSSRVGRQLADNVTYLLRMVRGTGSGHREHKEAKRCFKQLKKHHQWHHGGHGGKNGGGGGGGGGCGDGEGRERQYAPGSSCPAFEAINLAPFLHMVPGVLNSLAHNAALATATAATVAANVATTAAQNCAPETPTESQAPPLQSHTNASTAQQHPPPPFNFHDMLQNLLGHVAQYTSADQIPQQQQTGNATTPAENATVPTQDETTAAPMPATAATPAVNTDAPVIGSSATSINSVADSSPVSAVSMEVDPKEKEEELQQQEWTLLRAEDDAQAEVPRQVYPTLPTAPVPPSMNASVTTSPVLRLLHEMGFNHDDSYLNLLLQRYENNISQVVKHLVDTSNGSIGQRF